MVLLLVVLYNIRISDSPTLSFIREYLSSQNDMVNFCINVYDNSEIDNNDSKSKEGINYFFNGKNEMLSSNYNKGLQYCYEHGITWMVLLDQDTVLNKEFLNTINSGERAFDKKIFCYAPVIQESKTKNIISPYHVGKGFKKKFNVLQTDNTFYCINSCSIINSTIFREKIGRFSDYYPLDFLDHWWCKKAIENGCIFKLINIVIDHNLSLSSMNTLSISRLNNILYSQNLFFRNELSIFDNALLKGYLLFSCLNRLIKLDGKKSRLYFKYFLKRGKKYKC